MVTTSLAKLYSIRIRGLPLLSIQLVKIIETKSELLSIKNWCSARYNVRSLTFYYYINDIFELVSDDNLNISYVDDIVLVLKVSTWSMVLIKLQRPVTKVNK